ncbi:hypothetical protein ABIC73_004363 [Prescottella equi]|uniref:hypothetical protein n=1 Tax=Rhodococcus hoagii TaxID=43767 RepID=UPI003394156F
MVDLLHVSEVVVPRDGVSFELVQPLDRGRNLEAVDDGLVGQTMLETQIDRDEVAHDGVVEIRPPSLRVVRDGLWDEVVDPLLREAARFRHL